MTIAAKFDAGPEATKSSRSSDSLNPILVKEVRQALRGRYFKISFWFTLTVATIVGLTVLLVMRTSSGFSGEGVYGPEFFVAMFACLAVAAQIFVPFSAFLSMGSEWDENTYDLLVLSNLKPRQIVLGKVLSAGVQALLFYSAFGPFLVFAFLLRGVDLLALSMALTISLTGSLLLSCLAVAMSSFGKGRFMRLLLMVALAIALVWSTIGTVVWAAQMMMFPGQIHDPEVLQAIGAAVSIGTAVAAFFFAAACARLAHPEENRSSGLRWMTMASIAVGLGWLTYINWRSFDVELTVGGAFMAHGVLALSTLFYATEPEKLGRRVAVTLPKNGLLRALAMPILPGGARGLLFYIQGSVLIMVWMLLFSTIAKGRIVYDEGELGAVVALSLYGLIYLGIPSAIFGFHSESLVMRAIARVAVLALFIASLLLPALFGFLFNIEDWAEFEHPFNVFVATEDLWSGRGRVEGIWPLLIGGTILCLALNLPRIIGAMRELASRREPERPSA